MKNKVIFLGLMVAQSIVSLTDQEFVNQCAIHRNTLQTRGRNAKICLKVLKLKLILDEEERRDVNIALSAYFSALSDFHIFIRAKKAPEKTETNNSKN